MMIETTDNNMLILKPIGSQITFSNKEESNIKLLSSKNNVITDNFNVLFTKSTHKFHVTLFGHTKFNIEFNGENHSLHVSFIAKSKEYLADEDSMTDSFSIGLELINVELDLSNINLNKDEEIKLSNLLKDNAKLMLNISCEYL